MSSSLGWRDVGEVLLSNSDAARRKADERRGDGGRDEPIFQGCIMSRRSHRHRRPSRYERDARSREKEIEKETLLTDRAEVLSQQPSSRVKWLQKVLLLVGKKSIKAASVYDIVTDKKFVSGVSETVGAQMKAMLLANLHLFKPREQKHLQSSESTFSTFGTLVQARQAEERGGASRFREANAATAAASDGSEVEDFDQKHSGSCKRRRMQGRHRSSASDRSRSPQGREARTPAAMESVKSHKYVDPRIFARGVADDLV
mmetsp:Transcript_54419/g.117783  ORF Transcript_54419/g.117783 Transcript_54419/m.117783 type:complete len:259 (+) Transcript_54419:24-800(+)